MGEGDSFAFKDHPISNYLRELAQLRAENPALANGAMQIRYAKGSTFAFSKRASNEDYESIVVLNNSLKSRNH